MGIATTASPAGRRRGTEDLLHAVFFLVVAGSAVRLLDLNEPLCPYIISVGVTLAGTYAAGLTRWERLGRWRPMWLGVLLLLWLALVVLSPPSLRLVVAWVAVPLACLVVRALGTRASLVALVAITAVVAFAVAAQPGFDPVRVLVPVGAVWAAAMLYRRQQRLVDELRRTRHELADQQRAAGAVAERARIARELHDTLTQELAASRTLLQAADRDWQRSPERARERVRTVTRYLGDNLVEARRMIADLTTPTLDLPTALADLCARAQECGTAAEVDFHAVGEHRPLPERLRATLLRLVQGALANVRDHAHADHVTVTLRQGADHVAVEVRDDGTGFTPGSPVTAPHRGFGLTAMRQRLDEHGGALTVDSAPGHGTVLTARIPLPADVRQPAAVG